MATFSSIDKQQDTFNPYVELTPIDAMTKVGMIKQDQFNEGIKKVQGVYDTIAGLDLAKDADKQYVQTKLSDLTDNIKNNLSGDFADSRVTNQIAGAASLIYKDPNVQTAVSSTASLRNEQAIIAQAQKDGKAGQNNIDYFNNQVGDWLNDGKVGTSLNAKYHPYTNTNDVYEKAIKDAGLQSMETSTDLPFFQDTQGNYTDRNGNLLPKGVKPISNDAMIQRIFKGASPEKIQSILSAVTDGNLQQQLSIDAWAKYKNYTPQALKGDLDQHYSSSYDDLNSQLSTLTSLKSLNPNNRSYQADLEDKIASLKNTMQQTQTNYNNQVQQLQSSPDDFKTNLYTSKYFQQFSQAFSNQSVVDKYVNSPFIEKQQKDREYHLTLMKYYNDNSHWKDDYHLKEQQLDIERIKAQAELDKANRAIKGSNGLLNNGGVEGGISTDITPTTADSFLQSQNVAQNQIDFTKQDFKAKYFPNEPVAQFNRDYALYESQYNSKDGLSTNISPDWKDHFDRIEPIKKQFNQGAALLTNGTNTADKIFGPQEQKAENDFLHGKSSLKIGDFTYSPKDILTSLKKFKDIDAISQAKFEGPAMIAVPDQAANAQRAELYNSLSTKEKVLYKQRHDANEDFRSLGPGTDPLHPGDFMNPINHSSIVVHNILDPYESTLSDENNAVTKIARLRQTFINNYLNTNAVNYQPRWSTFNEDKDNKEFIRNVTSTLIGRINSDGGASTNSMGTFNKDEAIELNSSADTKITRVKQGNTSYVVLSGKIGSGENEHTSTQAIPLSDQDFDAAYNTHISTDPKVQNAHDLLEAPNIGNTNPESGTQYSGIASNPNAYKTAFYQKIKGGSNQDDFPNVKNYSVKADAYKLQNGALQPIIYILDTDKNKWITVPGIQAPDTESLQQTLAGMGDFAIYSLLNPTQKPKK